MPDHNGQYELLPRSSRDLDSVPDEFKDKPLPRSRRSIFSVARKIRRVCRVCRPLYIVVALVLFLLWQITFNTSYMSPPPFEIPTDEKVFIAANIIDGELIDGAWGKSLLDLVELIGKDRVYVSIYGGPTSALRNLDGKLPCGHSLVSEKEHPLDMDAIPRTKLPTGETRVKRIAYLAEVRNKALEPLDTLKTSFDKVLFINDVFFDARDAARLLWGTNVNDNGKSVYKAACGTDFVQWWKFYDTFATRDAEGYSIGVPIFPWFAGEDAAISRRDVLEGRGAVRVKSCWGGMTAFDARYLQSNPENSSSRRYHGGLDGDIGVDIKSTRQVEPPTLPLRFRSEPEPFWDSSECCLIYTDIMALPDFSPASSPSTSDPGATKDPWDTGIYMNPYVRVSYDAKTQSMLNLGKRFERLFALPQAIVNHFAHMPVFNARRAEVEGQIIKDKLWIPFENATGHTERDDDHAEIYPSRMMGKREIIGEPLDRDYWATKGHYVDFNRTATRGAYCGVRQLLVMKEGKLKEGEGNWDNLLNEVPPVDL
ncbi:Uncharacterized protein BP5553_07550 [Venustampulla echinocandica]|uniref:Glycosyltransferase family 69 protein n=1 Tax=Venustampulla echinocandica TaxID=2656787 RepID=A0A370TGV2_9HELO|nr:Uncharacterized protein BP5553_07550 [Venustampulla echinocandica]RDL34422.1 Uncharacterized protein BP5553_07550 [Venustampulla echinocandica]